MAGRVIGNVSFDVDLAGKELPAEAKALGAVIGEEMGAAAQKRFDARFDPLQSETAARLEAKMLKEGRLNGINFSNALRGAILSRRADLTNTLASIFSNRESFDEFVKSSDSVTEGLDRIRAMAEKLRSEKGLRADTYRVLSRTIDQWGGSLLDAETKMKGVELEAERVRGSVFNLREELDRNVQNRSRVAEAFTPVERAMADAAREAERAAKALETNRKSTNSTGSAWRKLSANTRQWVLIIGAIAAGIPDLAVLLQAAAAGAFILGQALGAVVVGGIVFAAAIRGMTGDLNALPASVRPAAAAIQGLAAPLRALQDSLQEHVFAGLADDIKALGTTLLPALQGSLDEVADSINGGLSKVIKGALDPKNITTFNALLSGSAPIITSLVDAALKLLDAIGNIAVIALPFTAAFADGLDKLLGKFDAFTKSASGKNAIAQFFADGADVLQHVIDLVGKASSVIGSLFGGQNVKNTDKLLDNVNTGLTAIQALLEDIAALDPFGLIAEALADLTPGLVQIFHFLEPILEILNQVAGIVLDGLGRSLTVIGDLLSPLTIEFQIFATLLQDLATYFQPISDAFATYFGDIQQAFEYVMFRVIEPGLLEILNAFFNTNAGPKGLADLINENLIPAAKRLWDYIKENILPKLKEWFDKTADLIEQAGGLDGILKKIEGFVGGFEGAMKLFHAAILPEILAVQALNSALDALSGKKVKSSAGSGSGGNGGGGGFAFGGILDRKTQVAPGFVAGEAGREAFIPLDQPLSSVDASVRDLAAFARYGGTVGGDSGKHLTVAPGAVAIYDSGDAETTAEMVLDRIAAEAAA